VCGYVYVFVTPALTPVFVWDNGDCPLGYFTHAMVTDDNVNFTFTEPHRNGVHHRFQLI